MSTKTKITLTDNEIQFMKLTLNYDTREAQHSDNYSNAGISEGMKALKWTASQMKGLMTSLTKKGMGCIDYRGVHGISYNIFWLSDEGIDTIFDIIEAEKEAEKEAEEKSSPVTMSLPAVDAMFEQEIERLKLEKAVLLEVVERAVRHTEYETIGNTMIQVNLLNAKIKQTERLQNMVY